MRAFAALYLTAAREFVRDRVSVILTLVLPLALAGFFGAVLGHPPTSSMSLGVALEDRGALSDQVRESLSRPGMKAAFKMVEGPREPLMASLQAGRLDAVLIVPAGSGLLLGQGRAAEMPLYVDASRPTNGLVATLLDPTVGALDRAWQGHSARLTLREARVERHVVPIAQLYVARMLAIAILWLGVFGTAPAWVALRDQKVLRRLAVTPLSPRTILASQIAWRLTVGLIQAAVLLGFGMVALHLRPLASWGWLIPVEILGTLVFVTLGLALANLARSAESLAAMTQLVQFPMMFLSGTLMPMEIFPPALRQVGELIPLTYLGDALAQLAVGAEAMHPLSQDVLVLLAWWVGLGALALWRFRWE